MLEITPELSIAEEELEFQAIRASGPGGQHVNKVASAVQLRFDIHASSLPTEVRERLMRLDDRRISAEGVVVIKAQRYRSQAQNRDDARDRLAALIRRATHKPKPRRPTRPSKAAKRRRLDGKSHRGKIKSLRKPPE